jgi:hypothetical protein
VSAESCPQIIEEESDIDPNTTLAVKKHPTKTYATKEVGKRPYEKLSKKQQKQKLIEEYRFPTDRRLTVDEQKYKAWLYSHSLYGSKHPGTPPNKEGKFE